MVHSQELLNNSFPLNSDILLYTLDLKIRFSPYRDRREPSTALNFIRCCSQVCRAWRQQIIHSPSIWGKLINLNELGRSDEWQNEVLRRAGSAPLWLRAVILNDAESDYLYPTFLWMLDKYWERIEVFYVYYNLRDRCDDPRWGAMRRPAPNLRGFHFQLYTHGPPCHLHRIEESEESRSFLLLNDSVPLLQYYNAYIPVRYQLRRPWFVQLRTARFSFVRSPLPDLLSAISSMPHLEDLEIMDSAADPLSTFPLVSRRESLSRLSCITVWAAYHTIVFILAHLRPAPGCSVVTHPRALLGAHHKTQAEQIFAEYARNFWDLHASMDVEMVISDGQFRILPHQRGLTSNTIRTAEHNSAEPPEFSVFVFDTVLEAAGDEFSSYTLFVLGCIPTGIFASITHLDISAFSPELANRRDDSLIRFLKALTCVEYFRLPFTFLFLISVGSDIVANSESFSPCIDATIHGVLPALHTLTIYKPWTPKSESESESGYRAMTVVTSALDPGELQALQVIVNFTALRRHHGLPRFRVVDLQYFHAETVARLVPWLPLIADRVLLLESFKAGWTQDHGENPNIVM